MTDQKRSEGIGTRGADSILQTAKSVIPFLLSGKSSQNMVRIWIPECGNGLVAYFVASQFMNCVREKISEVHVRIFATDALETSIEIASQGAFDKDEACEVFGEKLGDCFYVEENRWHIKPDIRRCVIFSATHQLYRDPPFERIDLIYASSRLLSDDMDKRSLCDVFAESLSNHGILMMEDRFEQYLNISGNSAFYRTDMPGVYQCRITNSVSDASYETGKKVKRW